MKATDSRPQRTDEPALEHLLEYLSDTECLTVLQWARRCAPYLLRKLMVSYLERQPSETPVEAGVHLEPAVYVSPGSTATGSPEPATLQAAEREHIARVLSESKTLTQAASRLGIHSTTLWRKRKLYNLE